MTSSAASSRAVAALLAGALACALIATIGCDREDGPAPPLAGTAVVRGRVGGSIGGASVSVDFLGAEPGPGERQFRVAADSTGRYELELPAGDYVVAAACPGATYYHAATGPDQRQDRADTLRLRAGDPPRTIDFPLGRLRLGAEVPTSLDGRRFLFQIRSRWPTASVPSTMRSGNALADGGRVELAFPNLLPGDYSIEVAWELDGTHRGDDFWLPDVTTLAQAARHRVGVDSTCTATFALAAAPARVTGSVTGAWRALGLSPPRVRAESPEGYLLAGDWEVDDNGDFAFDLYQPRPFRLRVRTSGPVLWVGGSRPEDATIFTPEPGQTLSGLDLVSGGLRLHVTLDDWLSEYQTAQFGLYDPVSLTPVYQWGSSMSTLIGVAGLPTGTWLLRVSHSYYYGSASWRSQWFDRASTPASAAPVVIPAGGGVAVLDLVLEQGGTILGTATSAAGDSTFVQALLTSADDEAVLDTWYFYLHQRDFRFQGLDDGLYRVGIASGDGDWVGEGMPPPADTVWYPGTTDWSAATDLAVAGGDTVRGVSILLP